MAKLADDRYIVISSDCHAGAPMLEYRDYLEHRRAGVTCRRDHDVAVIGELRHRLVSGPLTTHDTRTRIEAFDTA